MQRAGVSDVHFAGYVPDAELPRYYASADVFCAPNTANESQGYVLLEAMASGKPVVASNIEGFAGVVTHGVEGFLVLPQDADALALSLVHILADRQRRAEMGRHARARAEEFGWDRVAQRVLSYYERLLYERGMAVRDLPPGPLSEGRASLHQGSVGYQVATATAARHEQAEEVTQAPPPSSEDRVRGDG
jgi:phosphatidylinositol alpha-mannosyltransferase